jgi:hypothetical protein
VLGCNAVITTQWWLDNVEANNVLCNRGGPRWTTRSEAGVTLVRKALAQSWPALGEA